MSQPSSDATFRTNASGFRRDLNAPRVAVPRGACDTHMHIVGPYAAYPLRETRSLQPPEATLEDYRRMMAITGITRNVIVQPSFFARDNACTLDAAEALGENARAIVVVEPDIAESALEAMHIRGARGVRLQRVVAGGSSVESIVEIAARIQPFGWHIQLYLDAIDLVDLAPRLRHLPVDVVFDHMAQVRRDSGTGEPGFHALLDLMQSGKAWVKLSNARFVPDGQRARQLIDANAERVVWGSDWPHVAYEEAVPDESALLDALADWAPDETMRHRILVDNPGALYFGN